MRYQYPCSNCIHVNCEECTEFQECRACGNFNKHTTQRWLCLDCEEIIPIYIPEEQFKEYYEKTR